MLRTLTIGFAVLLVGGCGGGSGGASGGSAGAPVTSVNVGGRVTFDQVPFSATQDAGLDFARPVTAPVRGATVEIISRTGGGILASGVTDAAGNFSLAVQPNVDVFVRVKAEMQKTGTPAWNFSVRDNTNVESLYALDGSAFNTGTAAVTRNLHAASGWGGSSFTGPRAAAPFSVLDAVYQACQLVLTANPNQVFPELRMMWSSNNRPVAPTGNDAAAIAAQLAAGNIGTTFYSSGTPARIFVLGDASVDTDEFDQHVLAHEWGHYYQDQFSRDDSLGGTHDTNQRLDIRVAFSEGWGNAFSAMVKRDSRYRDSFFQASTVRDFSIDVESNSAVTPGAFSEASTQSIIYDLFDSNNDGADTVSFGFPPIHAAMVSSLRTTRAFTTLYTMLNALRVANATQAAAIDNLASSQSIAVNAGDFAANETNNGGDARNLPLFRTVVSGQTQQVCSISANGTYNRLGNRKFLRFDLAAAGSLTIRATNGPSGSDPDLVLYGAGAVLGQADSSASGAETLSVTGLAAGAYVIEAYEYTNLGNAPRGDTCFDLQVTAG